MRPAVDDSVEVPGVAPILKGEKLRDELDANENSEESRRGEQRDGSFIPAGDFRQGAADADGVVEDGCGAGAQELHDHEGEGEDGDRTDGESDEGGDADVEKMDASRSLCPTDGGYHFVSEDEVRRIREQRKAIWSFLKQLGTRLWREGVNLTRVSLPVVLFEPRSFLQRLCDNWAEVGLLHQAAEKVKPNGNESKTSGPAERLALVAGFLVSGLKTQLSFDKPFNPILGETFQGEFDDGTTVSVEQISHHPPVSAWWVEDPSRTFVFTGSGAWSATTSANSIRGRQSGTNSIRFTADEAVLTWELPGMLLQGVLWGRRVLYYTGSIIILDPKNGLKCELDILGKKSRLMDGSNGGMFSWFRWGSTKKGSNKEHRKKGGIDGRILRDDGEVLDRCTGSWMSHLEWEGAGRVWDAAWGSGKRLASVAEPLPSDCRYRKDIASLVEGDLEESQRWKVQLEEAQRRDRKLRQQR